MNLMDFDHNFLARGVGSREAQARTDGTGRTNQGGGVGGSEASPQNSEKAFKIITKVL